MRAPGIGSPYSDDTDVGPRVCGGWDIATVVAEFEVVSRDEATRVAELLFAVDEVFTVRVGGAGERSVYRVDVPRGDPLAKELGAAPAYHAARVLDIGVHLVRLNISRDGLGDPEGSPPSAGDTPWAARLVGGAN